MAESRDTNYKSFLSLISPLAAANFLFFCLEFILAVEIRSVSLFSDSIAFLEGASVSILMSPKLDWSPPRREAFANFSTTVILIPTCFMFWMVAANCFGAEIPTAAPLGDEAWLIGEHRTSGEKKYYLPICRPRRICAR
jgi:hypothetical protein